ncbi:MAG: PKD domain-containing protein, partial [Candidatus Zixiibacteriota bacterium]
MFSGCDELITETREVTISGYPGANFVASAETCCRPCSVQFFDNSNGPRHTYVWDFGDGDSSTAKDPIHVYTSAGEFNVTLFIRDTINGNEDNEVKLNYIEITDTIDADFTAPIDTCCLLCSLQFFDDSHIPCHEPVYVWDFGDGDSSSAKDPIHSYTTTGFFNVTLLIRDTLTGNQDFITKQNFIFITDSLYADFSAAVDSCCLPCSLQFFDNSYTPCQEPIYVWDFGDGDSSSAKDPIHYYTTTGLFDVSLFIRDTVSGNEDDSTKLNFVYIVDTLADSANADFSIVPPTGDTSAIYTFTELT